MSVSSNENEKVNNASVLKLEVDDGCDMNVEADPDRVSPQQPRNEGSEKLKTESRSPENCYDKDAPQDVHHTSKQVSGEDEKPHAKARVNGKSNKRQRCAVAQEGSIPVSDLRIEFDEAKLNLLQVFLSIFLLILLF
jgi:hypothetical protein